MSGVPDSARRAVALAAGVTPGSVASIFCHYCGAPGIARWWTLSSGKPSAWVSFTLEIDHVIAKASGGTDDPHNLVLACTSCNRQKGAKQLDVFLSRRRQIARAS